LNIFKPFYSKVVGLMDRLHAYEERTGKYLGHFKQNIDGAKIVVDVGCGIGAFSKALACGKRLVIALDLEKRLEGIENPYIESVRADVHHLPFRDGSVDCVLSHFLSVLKIQEKRGRVL